MPAMWSKEPWWWRTGRSRRAAARPSRSAPRPLPTLPAPARRILRKQGEPHARTAIMNGPLEWYAAIAGVIAAFMVAGDFGRKTTGLGFLLFATGSIAWIFAGLQAGTPPLAVQNAI